jgi:hypothetical protein
MKQKTSISQLLMDIGAVAVVMFIIFAIVSTPKAKAADLLIGQYTHHFYSASNWDECKDGSNECLDFNDSQELIGLAGEKWSIVYMHQNSVREKSIVVTRVFKVDFGSRVRGFAAAGLGTGYEKHYEKISEYGLTPVGYLGLDLHPKNDKAGLIITWSPDCFIGIGSRVSF